MPRIDEDPRNFSTLEDAYKYAGARFKQAIKYKNSEIHDAAPLAVFFMIFYDKKHHKDLETLSWDIARPWVMQVLALLEVVNNAEWRKTLLATGDQEIRYTECHELWGTGEACLFSKKQSYRNHMGNVWMEIRGHIREISYQECQTGSLPRLRMWDLDHYRKREMDRMGNGSVFDVKFGKVAAELKAKLKEAVLWRTNKNDKFFRITPK